ncbi:hypothetical protein [Streptomyces sp. NPDC127084]|uniref:hypothetical protein n=1 Tax=Streptomyces sp. NPDC127084 TaxID=3347133 RepID=UPI00364C6FF3
MARTSRTRRLVVLSASTALAAGGVLLPTSAFAATDSPHTAVTAKAAPQGDHWRHGKHGNKRGGGGNQGIGRGNVVIIIGNGNTVPINNGTVNNR